MKLRCFSQDHPNCFEDELFLGNFTVEHYQNISFLTKNRGSESLALDEDYKPIPFAELHGVAPVFVKITEYENLGFVKNSEGVWDLYLR